MTSCPSSSASGGGDSIGRSAGSAAIRPPQELHAVRILAKRVRYAADAVAPAVGKQARRFAQDAARIPDALGELNDASVAGASLAALTDRLDGPAAFAAGQMNQQLVVEARTHDRRWRAAHASMTQRTAWFS